MGAQGRQHSEVGKEPVSDLASGKVLTRQVGVGAQGGKVGILLRSALLRVSL